MELELFTEGPIRYSFAAEAITVTGCLQSWTDDIYLGIYVISLAETCKQCDNFLPP